MGPVPSGASRNVRTHPLGGMSHGGVWVCASKTVTADHHRPALVPSTYSHPLWRSSIVHGRVPSHIKSSNASPFISWPWTLVSTVRLYSSCSIDCAPSSVGKVHHFDSGDATSISRWTCHQHRWWAVISALAWSHTSLWMWPSVSGSICSSPSSQCWCSLSFFRTRWHSLVQLLLPWSPIRCKWAPHGNVLVTSCKSLCCTCHGTVLSPSRAAIISLPSRAHLFEFSHRNVCTISGLDYTWSTPPGSPPHPCSQFRSPNWSRVSNLYHEAPGAFHMHPLSSLARFRD